MPASRKGAGRPAVLWLRLQFDEPRIEGLYELRVAVHHRGGIARNPENVVAADEQAPPRESIEYRRGVVRILGPDHRELIVGIAQQNLSDVGFAQEWRQPCCVVPNSAAREAASVPSDFAMTKVDPS